MSSESYHESVELLSDATKDTHRALVSLGEELEAVDWYQQRAEVCSDPELSAVLMHNKNEEIEHAMMVLEWIRRKNPVFASNIDTYLKSSGPITEVEEMSTGEGEKGEKKEKSEKKKPSYEKKKSTYSSNSQSLGIGSLRGQK